MGVQLFLELLIRYTKELGPVVSFILLASIMGYMQLDSVKSRKHSDKKFNEILASQEEMKSEYRQGFIKVYEDLEKINERIEEVDDKQIENNLLALRSIITNTSLPVDYRLASFDSYVKKGGNSWIQDYVEKEILKKKDEEA